MAFILNFFLQQSIKYISIKCIFLSSQKITVNLKTFAVPLSIEFKCKIKAGQQY